MFVQLPLAAKKQRSNVMFQHEELAFPQLTRATLSKSGHLHSAYSRDARDNDCQLKYTPAHGSLLLFVHGF